MDEVKVAFIVDFPKDHESAIQTFMDVVGFLIGEFKVVALEDQGRVVDLASHSGQHLFQLKAKKVFLGISVGDILMATGQLLEICNQVGKLTFFHDFGFL